MVNPALEFLQILNKRNFMPSPDYLGILPDFWRMLN